MSHFEPSQLTVSQLSCERGSRRLFENLDFRVSNGQAMIIKGSNGVGKTSLLRILTGLSHAVEGRVCWNGDDIEAISDDYQRELLYIGHQAAVKTELTVRENLQLLLRFWPSDRFSAAELADVIGLRQRLSVLCSRLSAGQLRRVSMARLFISRQTLWVLDEPLTALDVTFIGLIEKRLEEHLQMGGIVILTTHRGINLGSQQAIALEM